MVSHRSSPEIRGKKPLGPGLPRDLQPGEVSFLRALGYSSPMAGARTWLSQSGNSCRGRTPRAPGSRLRRQCCGSISDCANVCVVLVQHPWAEGMPAIAASASASCSCSVSADCRVATHAYLLGVGGSSWQTELFLKHKIKYIY